MSNSRTSGMTAKNIYLTVFITDDRNNSIVEVGKDSELYKAVSSDFHWIMQCAFQGRKQQNYAWYVGKHLNDETICDFKAWEIRTDAPVVETQVEYYKGVVSVCLHIRK